MRERWSRILTARNVSRLPDLGTRRAWNDIAIAGLFVLAGSLLGVAIGIPLAIVLSVVAAKAMQTMVVAYGIAFAVCGATTGLVRAAIRRYPVFQTEYVTLRLSMVFAASGFVAGAFGGGASYALASSAVFLVLGVIVGMFVMIKCQKIAT
jgi:hypothetical protein